MGTPWSAFRQLKEHTDHSHMVSQHRANKGNEIQQAAGQPEYIPIVNPEQTEPLLPISSTQTGEGSQATQESGETGSRVATQTDLAHETRSHIQQPEPPIIPVANGTNPYAERKKIQDVAFQLHIDGSSVAKWAKSVCSGLVTILTQLRQGKSRSQQNIKQLRSVWKCIGVSAAGTKHSKTGVPCQDAWKYKSLPSGELVIAVADGAGSASLAQEGATLAVAVAINYLCLAIPIYKPNTPKAWTELISHAFEIARVRLIAHAVRQETAVRHYATTLQIVVVSAEWTVSGIVGDGIAVGLVNNSSCVSIMMPQHKEYVNATNFITGSSAMGHLDVQIRHEPVQGVAVLTDGLLPLSINEQNNAPHPGFFEPLFKFLDASTNEKEAAKGLGQFLNSSRVNDRTDDDKTLVLALREAV